MTERITTQMMGNMLLDSINSDLFQLNTTQNELSTGLKIQQPSDDPFGAGEALQLTGELSDIQNYTTNIQDGLGWTQTSSTALQSIYQMGQTAQTLVVQANSGTMSATDLNNMSDQVKQLIDAIKQAANTQYKGMYVFSGTSGAQPYSLTPPSDIYQGNSGSVTRQIGPGLSSQVAVNVNLGAVLGNGGGDGQLLSTLEAIATDLGGNPPVTTNLGNDLQTLQGNLGQLQTLETTLGAGEQQLNLADSRLQSLQATNSQVLASVQDVDMAQASIKYSTEQAGYQAALQSGAQLIQTSLLNFLHG